MNTHFFKRLITLSLLVSYGAVAAWCKPALPGMTEMSQPDGTTLHVQTVGDAFSHHHLTSDGYPLIYVEQSGVCYARLLVDGSIESTGVMAHNPDERTDDEKLLLESLTNDSAKISAIANQVRKQRRGPGLKKQNFPVKGEQRALVILVEFQDVKFDRYNKDKNKYTKYFDGENAVYQYWYDLLNRDGFAGFGAFGSCRDWFLQNSADAEGNSQFSPQFDVYGPVTLPDSVAVYGRNDNYNNDAHPQKMVIDACTLLDDTIDFSQYDRNGDGEVDNVFIFYAGYGEADAGMNYAYTIWPHSWDLTKNNEQMTLDGVVINHYACTNETDYRMGRPDGIGTFVHEFSHVMGLPDLYATNNSGAYTPKEYSVLDLGPYNNNGRTPPNYSTFERYALDWITPEEFGQSDNYQLSNLAESNKAYIVRTANENEFYLIENRQQSGWDTYIPGHGMLIWHIDYNPAVFQTNTVNNLPTHQYVDLIEANKRSQTQYADGHPFPGSSNVTGYEFKDWDRNDCGIKFSNIAENDGIVSFAVENTNVSSTPQLPALIEGDNVVYNLQGIPVTVPRAGDIVISNGKKYVVR